MKKRFSFSDNIIKTIRLIFGIAFLIIYIGTGILLFLTENDKNVFVIKSIGLFITYFILYLISVAFLTKDIKKQFSPLDKLAHGLRDNSIEIIGDNEDIKSFARQLRSDMERLDNLNKQLKITQENLDDAYLSNEKTINDTLDIIDRCQTNIVKINKGEIKLKDSFIEINNISDNIIKNSSFYKNRQRTISDNQDEIINSISSNIKKQQEIKEDFNKSCDAFKLLDQMNEESVDLIDSLYSEISTVQNLCSQINLYAMNARLEASRTGIFNSNLINALEELNELSKKIQERTDNISLLSIRSKNSLNLAKEQSDFCREIEEDGYKFFDKSIDNMSVLSESIKHSLICVDEMVELSNNLFIAISKLNTINSDNINHLNYIMDKNKAMANSFFDIDRLFKNNDFS